MEKYKKICTKFVEDIKSNVTIYEHIKSKARICTIENDDNNKVFTIAFRTPPINNGGLTHILEHSVLCGSSKYPVKDPFVELLKSSLNTFLNAFTAPDKTIYPIASGNDKDFKNLMSVYMDAVFYPQIYKHKEIFMQEGWHYHLENESDPITINGVVYNEMKGAFSDPQQILFRNIMHSLYPDNAYGFESGGDPKYIPSLSYEEFLNFHSKYYHPSNSYIYLYGNCDMNERMEWLDKEYLSKFEAINFDTNIKYQPKFSNPVSSFSYYPIDESQELENKTFLSYNVVFSSALETKKMIASKIILEILFNNPGAPLKQKLLDKGLCDDILCDVQDDILQPFMTIIGLNSNSNKESEFIDTINEEFKNYIMNGLDHNAILSIINYQEFKVREAKFGRFPRGLDIILDSLCTWLYSTDATSRLETLKYYKELRDDLNNGYFEDIIKNDFLNNNHKTYVRLVPSYDALKNNEIELTNKLDDFKKSLTKEEIKKIVDDTKALEIYQRTPSTKEELDTLPKLCLDDLDKLPQKLNLEVSNSKFKTLFSNYFTNNIDYIRYSFDLTNIDTINLHYANLLTDLLRKVSTKNHSYNELHQMCQNLTGGLTFNVIPYSDINRNAHCMLTVGYSCLNDNLSKAFDLVKEIMLESVFDDFKRLKEILNEVSIDLEMGIPNRGHVVSFMRAASYINEFAYLSDQISGIGYLEFVRDILNNFDAKKSEIVNSLNNVIKFVFTKERFLNRFTGSKECFDNSLAKAELLYDLLPNNEVTLKSDFKADNKNEGFKSQFDVNYVSRVGMYNEKFNGAMYVLNNALSLDYLWNEVRVHGGAYGCMLQTPPTGIIGFLSYRDPNIKRTNLVYEGAVDYIKNFNPNDEELLKYKIGAIGSLDSVMHNSVKGDTAQRDYLCGNSYEIKAKYRTEAINSTNEDLRNLSTKFKEALASNSICVIGNANKIEEEKTLFKEIKNL